MQSVVHAIEKLRYDYLKFHSLYLGTHSATFSCKKSLKPIVTTKLVCELNWFSLKLTVLKLRVKELKNQVEKTKNRKND